MLRFVSYSIKHLSATLTIIFVAAITQAQPVGYYNGVEGKTGQELKAALHNIIKNHKAWEYSYCKNVFAISDRDPNNQANVICVYTGRSEPWNNYGVGENYLSREHVWAKSHGAFGESKPTGADYHNLKPCDGSVNQDRGNKDFDICQGEPTVQQHNEATECYFTPYAWEPRNAVKGDIARIIFYMDTRYEGDGEINLEVVDEINTAPQPKHGKLSALFQWNKADRPDNFEHNRNNTIYTFQKNRNPFIDNPEWVSMIWGNQPAPPIAIGNMQQSADVVTPTTEVTISATAQGQGIIAATLKWGTEYNNLVNEITMALSSGIYSATIPALEANTRVYLQVAATNGTDTSVSVTYNYKVQPAYSGAITPIAQVQGEAAVSPFENQVVTVSGVVTGNYGQGYFIQDAQQVRSGLYIYDIGRNPEIGDSVIITGKIIEYYELTEMTEVSLFQLVERNKPLPDPVTIATGADKEPYESVLVKLTNAQVTSTVEGFGLWKVNDGSGELMVHNTMIYNHNPTLGQYYDITAPLTYDHSEWKMELRSKDDVQISEDIYKPSIIELAMTAEDYIWLYFNEPISQNNIENVENYTFNTSMTTISARKHPIQPHVIILNVARATLGPHTITVKNIADMAGNIMDEQQITFFSQYNNIHNYQTPNNVIVYPNPTTNAQVVLDNIGQSLEIQIYDMSGKVVRNIKNINAQTVTLNDLPKGVLTVRLIKTDKTVVTKKIVVE